MLTPPPQVDLSTLLTGLPNQKNKTSGISLMSELEDKWNGNIFKDKKAEADLNGSQLSKRAMFDRKTHLFLGFNNTFVVCKE